MGAGRVGVGPTPNLPQTASMQAKVNEDTAKDQQY